MANDKINYPKISIIVPCRNAVDYIERSIRSAIEQDYPNLELVIQDGGSKDGTVEIIKYYAKKYPSVINWESTPDKGQADAINKGLKRTTGEILTYLNADDVYKDGSLKIIGDFFKSHSEVMWAYGQCDIIDGDGREIRKWITSYKNFWMKNYSYTTLLIINYISQMGCFWRRVVYEEIGDFDINQYLVLDYDYWLRTGRKYKPGVISKYIASFRITANNKSSLGFLKQFNDELKVSQKYTNNNLIIFLHIIHSRLIVVIYSLLRLINTLKSPNKNVTD